VGTSTVGASPLEGFFLGDFQSNPHLVGLRAGAFETLESDYRRHGLRIHEVRTPYLDWEYGAKEGAIRDRILALRGLGVDWNQRLRQALDHGALLEAGTFTLKGDERLTIGTYLELESARYYIEGVTHLFRQGTGPGDGMFLTTAQVTRGRGHLVRAQLGAG
jgi:hypothetical protein